MGREGEKREAYLCDHIDSIPSTNDFPLSSSSYGKIVLSNSEVNFFQLLLQARESNNLTTEIRVAGGWVRDKLLNFRSSDLDIALDNCTGEEFAQHVLKYLGSKGKIGKSKENPEKSKHLATAFVHIGEFEVDFVNLRTEDYTDSRIPQMKFGTAREDAFRRDFTINALFYNILTNKVEDLTGKGLEDLQKQLLQTPLPAIQTFADDPLRMLRAIRFATRLSFTLRSDGSATLFTTYKGWSRTNRKRNISVSGRSKSACSY